MNVLILIYTLFILSLCVIYGWKRFLYAMAAFIIVPISLWSAVIYGVLYVFQYTFQLIYKYYGKLFTIFMKWVDKNITPNL